MLLQSPTFRNFILHPSLKKQGLQALYSPVSHLNTTTSLFTILSMFAFSVKMTVAYMYVEYLGVTSNYRGTSKKK